MKRYWFISFVFATVFTLLCADSYADRARTLRGAVVSADGTMVDQFTVVARPVTSKPELIRRFRFTNGTFVLRDLQRQKYEVTITAPRFIGVRMDVDFPKNGDSTEFKIIVLHHLRNERYFPGSPIGTFNVRLLQDDIPVDARLAYERGVEFHKDGRLEEALEAYGTAIRIAPKYIQPVTDAGTIYLILNRPEAAMVFLRRGLDLDPNNPIIRLNVALALTLKKDYDGALKLLDSVMGDVADKSLPHLFQARAYYLQKKYAKAADLAKIALNEDPRLLDGWQLLINIAADQKDYAAVRENLENMRQAIRSKEFARFVDDQIALMAGTNN